MKPRNAPIKSLKKPVNSGFAVLFVLLGLMIVGGIIVLKSFNANSGNLARQQVDTDVLARAKLALLTRAIYDDVAGWRPGNLLIPDYLDGTAIGYDGVSGSGCQNFASPNGLPLIQGTNPTVQVDMRCIGRLPWKTLGMDGSLNKDFSLPENRHDGLGEVPWYAVSANLVDPTCFTVLNSTTLNAPAPAQVQLPGALCSSSTNPNPVHPWLTVHDESGKILSSQVAAVLILPGVALAGQARPPYPAPAVGAAQYLDAMTIEDKDDKICKFLPGAPAAPCVINNAELNNHFVSGSATSTFNDRLIFITVKELVEQLQKRVASQMRASVKEYIAVTNKMPWLGNLPAEAATVNTSIGLLPLMPRTGTSAPTEFSWSLEVAAAAIDETGNARCIKLSGTPDTYIRNQLFESIKNPTTLNFRLGSTGAVNTPAAGQCKWKNGALTEARTAFECSYTATTTSTPNLDTYSILNDCENKANVVANKTFNIQRTVNVSFNILKDTNCAGPDFASSVQEPSATDVGRVTVVCGSINANNIVAVADTYTDTTTTQTVNATVQPASSPLLKITVSNMRFSPYIPDWFTDNGWDKSSLVALANSAAPSTPIPDLCAGEATLKVGNTTGVRAIAIVSGAPLSTQTRPSPLLSNYIESLGANCAFSAQSKPHSPTYNDTILTILP